MLLLMEQPYWNAKTALQIVTRVNFPSRKPDFGGRSSCFFSDWDTGIYKFWLEIECTTSFFSSKVTDEAILLIFPHCLSSVAELLFHILVGFPGAFYSVNFTTKIWDNFQMYKEMC